MGSSRLLLCLCKKKSTVHSCAVLFVLVEITGIEPPDVKIGTTIFSKKAKNKPHKVSHWVKTIGKPYAAYSYLF